MAVCWCRDCQRIASNGSVNAIVPNAAIEVTGGLAEYESDAASGGQLRYRFCHRCGSHLFGNSTTAPDLTVGQRYEVRLVSFAAIKESAHRALQPFGQIPTYQEGDLALFESGAIVLHVAERHAGLLPQDPDARARAAAWMFAAVGTVEPPIVEREAAMYQEAGSRGTNGGCRSFGDLSARLGVGDWLDGDFSAGDLLMLQVLRRLKGSTLIEEHTNLVAYVECGEARPAFGRAFEAQRAGFAASIGGNSGR